MDKKSLSLIIGIFVFLALLYGVVLPMLRYMSQAVQGEPFTYRLQTYMKSKSTEKVARWDILWSATAVMLAIAATLGILMLVAKFGIIPE